MLFKDTIHHTNFYRLKEALLFFGNQFKQALKLFLIYLTPMQKQFREKSICLNLCRTELNRQADFPD